MEKFETKLADTVLFRPQVFDDSRGFFYEGFNKRKLKDDLNIGFEVVQINQSKSSYGVLRGLHFQKHPYSQAKLVSVIVGEVLDVAVDLRIGSPTFGQWESVLLTEKNQNHFYIPRGFAHGFVVKSESARFMYAIDNEYAPDFDSGIIYNDPTLTIDWQIDLDAIILSNKDRNLSPLKEIDNEFTYNQE
ncbi:MAG: dTDP-4-dehydrorhamnose 3,5-epimerase [Cyclobacteriaceae bacterium]